MRLPSFFALTVTLTTYAAVAGAQANRTPEARVLTVHGSVEVTAPEALSARPATAGDVLTRGTRLRVADAACARVALPNGVELTLLPGAQVMLFTSADAPPAGRPPSTVTTLEAGTVRATPAPEGSSMIPFALGGTTVNLGRAQATLSASRGTAMARVSVHQGRLLVRTGAVSRPLRGGQGVRDTPVGPRAPIAPLPGAAAWREAPPSRVASLGGAATVRATFQVAGAVPAGWRVDLARDEAFRDLVTSERLTTREPRWQGRVEGGGEWYARVSAVDAAGLEGPPSRPARFVVETPGIVPGAPATADAPARPTMLRVPEGVYCGVDGARLARMPEGVRLMPARAHRIRCAADAEGTNAQEFAVSAAEAGPLRHEVQLRATGGAGHVLSVRLSDLDGHPIPYATVAVGVEDGVALGEVRESTERGVSTAPIQWSGARARLQLRFTVNGGATFTEDVAVGRP
jgi:hypothetical protein